MERDLNSKRDYDLQNVLHWHIVDEESFPIEIPSYPLLWKGAYSYVERYTMDDAREIVEYVPNYFYSICRSEIIALLSFDL